MFLVAALIVLALITGVLGALIKGAFWLLVLTVLFIVVAFYVGRVSRST